MNQYRCETCNKDPCIVGFEACPIWSKMIYEGEEFRDYKITLLGQMRVTTQYTGCTSHSDFQSERDLDDYCKIGLYWYVHGDEESEDVGLCRGKSCNYCGRYNEELRQQAGEQ